MLKKIALQSLIWKGKKLLGIRGFKRGANFILRNKIVNYKVITRDDPNEILFII